MNYPELRAAIARSGKLKGDLAKDLSIGTTAFYNKCKGRSQFKQNEISQLARELQLTAEEVNNIFFDGGVN